MHYDYNENGKLIHYKNSKGYEQWREYDEDNNLIHAKDSKGKEVLFEYDENGNCILAKYTKYTISYKYDENGNNIYIESAGSICSKTIKEFDENNRLVYSRKSTKLL